MRIAVIAPPWAPVPPPFYGGIEVAIHHLVTGLKEAGNEVLLCTTGDSTCPVPRHWVLDEAEGDRIGHAVPELRHVLHAYEAARGFDIVHDHTTFGPVHAERHPGLKVVSTIHNPLDADLADLYNGLAGGSTSSPSRTPGRPRHPACASPG